MLLGPLKTVNGEMIQHRPYTHKVDGYSFGIIQWELLTSMLPFQKMTAVQAALVVVNEGVRPEIPNDCLPVLSEIMTCCWDANPDNQPPFSQMVRMLEVAETEIIITVRKARFRCCMSRPMTIDCCGKRKLEARGVGLAQFMLQFCKGFIDLFSADYLSYVVLPSGLSSSHRTCLVWVTYPMWFAFASYCIERR
ncbi:hypothetical protein H5410_050285 [Solanum commersonii]|uniref:Protein kinase domain-containing protein n=1 Tax=Solanum commersonii TaxID=4109 RepID=A0A9J5WV34_SOLCO|nr:hypothetical protein H5410_050285 [Solanum commersonii]